MAEEKDRQREAQAAVRRHHLADAEAWEEQARALDQQANEALIECHALRLRADIMRNIARQARERARLGAKAGS